MLSARKITFSKAISLLAPLCLALPWAATAQIAEREPAFRDNFYDVATLEQQSWIVGYYGTILYSADSGATWTLQNSQTQEALFRVVFADKNTGWVSGSYGTILATRDGGKSWQKQTSPTQEHLFGLHIIDTRLGWAVGGRGVILRTENGGTTWAATSVGEDIILNDVRFFNAQKGWAVGEYGRIYQTKDGGRSWVKQKSPIEVSLVSGESRNLFRLLFGNANRAWAFGLDGAILRSQGGERWELASPDGAVPPTRKSHHLFSAAFSGTKKWAVGERGTVLISQSDKDLWQSSALKIPPVSLNGVAFNGDGRGLIVGNRGLILRTRNGGGDWQQIRVVAEGHGKGVGRTR